MNDVSLVALLARTLISLAVVLVIVAIAYRIAKRRATGAPRGGTRAASSSGLTGGLFSGRSRSAPAPVEVVGRVGLTRGTAAVAVRFGERIVLVSATDQGPSTVLAEMDGEEWDRITATPEVSSPILTSSATPMTALSNPQRPSFVEALRQATSRHA